MDENWGYPVPVLMRVIPINVCHEVMNRSHIQKLDKTSFFLWWGTLTSKPALWKNHQKLRPSRFPGTGLFSPTNFAPLRWVNANSSSSRTTVEMWAREFEIYSSIAVRCIPHNIYIYIMRYTHIYIIYIYTHYIYTHYIYIECVYIIEYLYTHCTSKSTLVTSYIPI